MKQITRLLLVLCCYVSFAQQPLGMYSATNVTRTDDEQAIDTDQPDIASVSAKGSGTVNGSITANLSVSATGGAQYTVPIHVPPGMNGVQPEIALTFDSQSGNGIAGWGWNISGLSVITRIPATEYHDGYIDPVDFDGRDRFALDGQRLMVKTGNYGGNGTVYQTETYSNMKIISVGSHPDGRVKGPRYFKVLYPDGSVAHYGRSDNSRSLTDYAISYFENPQGVRISYVYTTSGNTLYLERIRYGGTSYAGGLFEVLFEYRKRDFVETAYMGGIRFVRDKRLDKIAVKDVSGKRYKGYSLIYRESSQGYDKLGSLREISSVGILSRGIVFYYDGSEYTGITVSSHLDEVSGDTPRLDLSQVSQRNANTVPLDYTGDGKMDFILYPTLGDDTNKKLYLFSNLHSTINYSKRHRVDRFEQLFPVSWLSDQNRLMPNQGIALVQHTGSKTVRFRVIAKGQVSPWDEKYTRSWVAPTYSDIRRGTFRIPLQYLSGDFNGDGLSDVIAIEKRYQYKWEGKAHFINLDRRLSSSNFVKSVGKLSAGVLGDYRLYSLDVNGDGKTDIVQIKKGKAYIYSFNHANNRLEWIGEKSDPRLNPEFPILAGDYNGDGKSDFLIPTGYNSKDFLLFSGTGKGFTVRSYNNQQFTYKTNSRDRKRDINYTNSLIPVDMNGDGKTDLIEYMAKTYDDHSNGTQKILLYPNVTRDSYPRFSTPSSKETTGKLKYHPIPIFLSSNDENANLQFATISNKWVKSYQSKYDHREDISLKEIRNNGLRTRIRYMPLTKSYASENHIYVNPHDQTYPFVNINVAPSFRVVKALEQKGSGLTRKQLFYFEGAVSHIGGLGFTGFKLQQRTNWHGVDVPALWTTSKHDPQLRNAITERVVSEQNSTYTGYQIQKDDYHYDQTVLTNNNASRYKGVFNLRLERMNSHNRLTDVSTEERYRYDQYNNQTEVISQFPRGSRTVQYSYSNNAAAIDNTYHIGRQESMQEMITRDGDSFTTEEQYSYNNNLVTSIKRKGHNTAWITESFTHDRFGNVLSRTLQADQLADRTERFEYGARYKYRLMTKSTDVDGLSTTYDYDPLTSNLTATTNPYGLTTKYTYDVRNRMKTETDYLDKVTTNDYIPLSDGGLTHQISYATGAKEETTYNAFGWMTRQGVLSLNNEWVYTDYEYYLSGQLKRQSEPHHGSASQWNTIKYDMYGRPISQEYYTGKNTIISYSGLTTTVNDGIKQVSTTKDALGSVVTLQDPGGTVNYTYFASGQLKAANYDSHVVTIDVDGWGRKTRLTDPSAGTYTYAYTDFGEVLEQTTPKGKTTYQYDDVGRVIHKAVTGDLTDLSLSYIYDGTTKQLTRINGVDNTNKGRAYVYEYEYDNYQRPTVTTEDTGLTQFEYHINYDAYGRVAKETHISNLSAGASNSLTTRNVYDSSGILSQIWNDGGTPRKLWQLDRINARGQALSVTLGNGIVKHKSYDNYGYLTEIKDEEAGNTPSPVMALHTEYDFNAEYGTLKHRENHAFNWKEQFEYDNQYRLTTISGDVTKTMRYDNRGRIEHNTSLGDYDYAKNNTYRLQTITPNENGMAYFGENSVQSVRYNAYKKPVEIHETGKGRVSFEYGPMMSRSTAYYGGEDEDRLSRRYRKHYSSILPIEIVEDTEAGSVKIVNYIAGDAYSAPMVHIKQTGANEIDAYHYLHRDYLGSILAITDADGEIKEERQFGAWGTVDKFLSSNGNTSFDHSSLLGRGYTGHEHFFEVGLIHMNGRMYDAHLGRFLSPDNYIQDPYNTQNYNRYGYVLNNPLMFNDPSGEFIHILVGAAIGGVVNLAIKAAQGKINSWGDGFAAFGIGAAAGAIGAATGGAAFLAAGGGAAGAGGFLAGAVGGMVGTAFASPIQNIGNHLYFGDPLMSVEQYVKGVVIGGLVGGAVNGSIAAANGKNFWNGNLSSPLGVTVNNTIQPQEIDDSTLRLQNAKNEIKSAIPDNGGPIKYKTDYYSKVSGPDGNHNWNRTSIEIVSDHGKVFPNSVGGDGNPQTLIQMVGDKYGTQGVFEVIIRDGAIHHQRFIPGGIMNGIPNQAGGGVSPPLKWW